MCVDMSTIYCLCIFCCLLTVTWAASSHKALLVSMDGFRWDYLNEQTNTPNFDKFAQEGVRATYMEASFPTKTFPDHYTMVTGLYSESNGITENYMYDPVFNSTFSMSTKETRWWEGGEPIWVTAKKQGLRTGTYFWPGSESEIQGIRPDYWFPYSDDDPYTERVDKIIDWFVNQNVTLATLYYPEPDKTGHSYGPDTPEVRAKVEYMDEILGYLMEKLKENGLEDDVNVIVTSDHGMTAVDTVNRVVDITDYLDMKAIKRIPSWGAVLQILPEEGRADAIVRNLTGVPHIEVYKKEDIPERYHYKDNRRIMPVVVIAEDGWLLTTDKTKQAQSTLKGQHGYDNALESMRPIFLAMGPNFKRNYKSNYIRNVDIYPMMCELLDIQAAPNNGSISRVAGMIQDSPSSGSGSLQVYSVAVLLILLTFNMVLY